MPSAISTTPCPETTASKTSSAEAASAPTRGSRPSHSGPLALAWLLHQDEHVVPLPGGRPPAHIAENLAAVRVQLHPDTLARIDQALSRFTPEGTGALLGD
ncbi:aldo/keto reductase [Streptomyces sp. NPDC051051]|uniref:aldo/keto reductase n=1 Tax=Streptomyces sp. NPDC051051 TaxID=3155666 RepID=UPI00341AB2E5